MFFLLIKLFVVSFYGLRLSIKDLFCDTIEQICRRIKGNRNTKENLHIEHKKLCNISNFELYYTKTFI